MPNDVFNDDPQWVDLNNYFTELSDKVGLSSDQFRLLVENTYYLKNHLGLADVDVGGVVARYGTPGTEPSVTIVHREETEAGKTTDYFDYLFTLPAATLGATATARAGNSAAVSVTPTPVYNEDEQVIGYNFAFDFTLPKGDKGDAGITPHIYNGNWWIGQTDTGVTAKGNVWYKGSEPLANVGANGDMFLKTNGDVYQKENGVWSYYTNIKGPKGDDGGTIIEDGSVTYSKLSTGLQSSIDDIDNKVDKVVGKGLSTNDYTTEEKQKLAGIVVPTKTSDLTNDSGFITKAVADLANYYLKNETYTKTEIGNLISAIPKFSIKVINALPVTDISDTTVYLVRNTGSETQNLYDEYIYVNDGTEQAPDWKWEKLGSQTVDLSGYVQTSRKINNKALTSDITLDASDVGALPSNTTFVSSVNGSSGAITDIATTSDLNNHYTKTQTDALLSGKQATIDSSHKLNADLIQNGTTNKTVTATEKSAWDSKYTKPSGGIPKTDLASAVQTSLGLADSAVQDSDLATVATSGSYNDLIDKPTSVVVDSALSSTSENPVQNKVITAKFAQLGYFPNLSADVFDIGQGGSADLEFKAVTHAGTNETISWQYFKGGQSYSGYFGDIVNAVKNYNNAGNAGYADKIVSTQAGTESGYITFASGLKIAWGVANHGSSAYDWTVNINYGIRFVNKPTVVSTPLETSGTGCFSYVYHSLSETGCTLRQTSKANANGKAQYVYWIAIGY